MGGTEKRARDLYRGKYCFCMKFQLSNLGFLGVLGVLGALTNQPELFSLFALFALYGLDKEVEI